MNKARNALPGALLLLMAATAACRRQGAFQIPELSDAPEVAVAVFKDMPDYAPAYGIVTDAEGSQRLEVTIGAADSPRVQVGQRAAAYLLPSTRAIECRVSRVLRGVSEETGQSIAWLSPAAPLHRPPGDFLYAKITFALKRRALTVPASAVFIRDGRPCVLRQGSSKSQKVIFAAVPVETGLVSEADTEIRSGLVPGDRVAVGGLGFLYPDFKADADE